MVESAIRLQQSVGDQSVHTSGFNILHVDPGVDYCGFAEFRQGLVRSWLLMELNIL